MTEYIDISVGLAEGVVTWPGSTGYKLTRVLSREEGAFSNNSHVSMDVHVGTHVDAPCHFVAGGHGVDQLELEKMIGPAVVVHLPDIDAVTAACLESLDLDPDVRRLLFRTRNSQLWRDGERVFDEEFVALTSDAAEWTVSRGIALVGVDYLSVQRFRDGPETHEILLSAGVVVLEGLDLSKAAPGRYMLYCLPVKLVGSDGAPARAVLVSDGSQRQRA